MGIKPIIQSALVLLLLFSLSVSASAQKKTRVTATDKVATRTTTTGISAADQKAIVELFKGVDASKYRLQFNSRQSVHGSRKVEMRDVQQIKRVNNPAELAGWIVFVVEGDDVIYVLAVGNSDLQSVIGKEKAAKLNAIMAKYR